MNQEHRVLCASPEWGKLLGEQVLPWVLEGLDLGDDVLEIGPGPGVSTDVLVDRAARLTAVELDLELAEQLARRLADASVTVIQADASELPLEPGFSAACCFTMLHHVPTRESQDRLLAEMRRMTSPGGIIVGSDSLETSRRRALHAGDVYLPIPPDEMPGRLEAAGFVDVEVSIQAEAGSSLGGFFRFRGRVPG